MSVEHCGNDIGNGKRSSRRRTCLVGTSSTTEITWTSRESSPFHHTAMPTANHLNHDTAVKDEYQPEV